VRLCALSDHIGDEVLDLDLRAEIDEPTAERLRRALAERHLLLFRGQSLSAEDQVRIGAVFGEPVDEGGDGKRFVFVSNVRADGVLGEGRQLLFHSDNMFTAEPLSVVGLFGLVIGDAGAPTRFANTERACGRLPAGVRAELEGATAVHLSGFAGGWYRYRDHAVEPHHPRAVHPVLRGNPTSGGIALCVSEQQTDRIFGWDPERSEAMLRRLFQALYEPGNIWQHEWRAGDLVVWDNIALQHGRPALTGAGERTLRRVAMVEADAKNQRAWTRVSLVAEGKG